MNELVVVTRAYDVALDLVEDGRTISGRCVPYDTPTLVADPGVDPYMETWKRGAFRNVVRSASHTALVFGHADDHLNNHIGHAVELVETDGGLDAVFRAYDDDDGRKALAMIGAGSCRGLSIRAVIGQSRTRRDGTVERTLVKRLPHVALVTEPAYAAAAVTTVREHGVEASGAPGPNPVVDELRAAQDEWRLLFPADE